MLFYKKKSNRIDQNLSILLLITFSFLSFISFAQTTICYQSGTSSYNPDADANVVAKLTNLSNFGAGGAMCENSFQFQAIADNFTESILVSNGCQIWWSGFESDGVYTATELSELSNWFSNGGFAIAGCDATGFDPVCNLLGLTLSGLNGDSGTSAPDPAIAGCFPNLGNSSINNGGGAMDGFTPASIASYTVITVATSNANGAAGLNGLSTSVYGNGVFATTDVNMFTSNGCCLSAGSAISNGNDLFLADAMCVLADAANGDNCFDPGPPPCNAGSDAPLLSPN